MSKGRRGLIIWMMLTVASAAVPTGGSAQATAAARDGALPIDQLLSIESVVSSRESHQWSPDGSEILVIAGGSLATIGPNGGELEKLAANLGSAGVFLASQQPRYSPDGKSISFIRGEDYVQELRLWSESEQREIQLTNLGARINSYAWSPDGRWIAFAGDRNGSYDIWKVAVPGGEVYRLTSDMRSEVYPYWTPDSQSLLYVRLDERWLDHDIFEMDEDGGNPRLVVSDENMFDYQDGGKFGYPMVSPDGRHVLFRSDRSGWLNYWIVPRNGGEPRQIAAQSAEQSDARWSPDGRRIAFTSNTNGTHSLYVVASEGGAPTVLVNPDGMGVVSSPAWSPEGSRISYTLETPTHPADLFVVSAAGGSPTRLTNSPPGAALAAALVSPEKVRFPSTDGLTIPAYLYRPENITPGQKLPGLLWIHGGPTSQFHDTFQQHVQFFVQRGYVVLMPNIRGSSGYGREFEDANNGCWGRCDLDDVLAGVEFLKEQDYIDIFNIGITGTSYGGIMSMASPTFAPGVFQAAVPIAGYADLPHFMEEQEIRHIKLVEYELGPLDENRELYERLSAINFVSDIRTPFFVIHGTGHFPQSEAGHNFVKELKRHYKPVKYKTYPNENYYIYRRDNRRQMLLDMLEFFDQYLKDGAATTVDSSNSSRAH